VALDVLRVGDDLFGGHLRHGGIGWWLGRR
jgi:hypothetical protein